MRGGGRGYTYFEEVGVAGGVEVEVGVGGIFGLGGWMEGWFVSGEKERRGEGRKKREEE